MHYINYHMKICNLKFKFSDKNDKKGINYHYLSIISTLGKTYPDLRSDSIEPLCVDRISIIALSYLFLEHFQCNVTKGSGSFPIVYYSLTCIAVKSIAAKSH